MIIILELLALEDQMPSLDLGLFHTYSLRFRFSAAIFNRRFTFRECKICLCVIYFICVCYTPNNIIVEHYRLENLLG